MRNKCVLILGLFCWFPAKGNCSQEWTPIKFSLYPPAVWPNINKVDGLNLALVGCGQGTKYVNGAQVGAFNCVDIAVKGVQIGIISNYNSAFSGFQAAGFVNINNESSGVSIGAINATHTHYGVQIGLLANYLDVGPSVQFGTANFARGWMRTGQVGVYNYSELLKGVQIGAVNRSRGHLDMYGKRILSEKSAGVQIGLYNYTGVDCAGVQIGALNVCRGTLHGFQLGALNFAGRGGLSPITIGMNWGFGNVKDDR